MKLKILNGLSPTTRAAFWISSVLFIAVLLNLIYGYLLHEPKLASIVPASTQYLTETLVAEGESVTRLLAIVNNHYQDVDRYINNIRTKGNIFQSTTLGVFVTDSVMADYVYSHQQYQISSVAVNSDAETTLRLSNVIWYDINRANTLFRNALLSRNPTRWRKMVEAKLILHELQCLLNKQVGERVRGGTLTYQMLKGQ